MNKAIEKMKEVEAASTKVLGFWIYLMTDCILFASLFATFIILRGDTYMQFNMPLVLTETIILLVSSFVCGIAVVFAKAKRTSLALAALVGVIVLGVAFLSIEMSEFRTLITEGNGWQSSAFMSSFFTLVGTHGFHIAIGLLWAGVLLWKLCQGPIGERTLRQLILFSLFWHFLDIIWIFIFSIVYLMGVQ